MTGGIDWLRWHHGSVTDPKFQLVARQANASLSDVVAVWALILEAASASDDRGAIGKVDTEVVDCLFGFPSTESRTDAILSAFEKRGLTKNGRIAAWHKRQPKRERDDSSAGRTNSWRERKASVCDATETRVTPCDAKKSLEESREEVIQEPTVLVPEAEPQGRYRVPPCPTEELVALYHRNLPALPAVEVMNDGRKRALSTRWRDVCGDGKFDKVAGLEWFDWFFQRVSASDFLTGKTAGRNGRIWRADFDFLITPSKFVKIVEGHYHHGERS